MFREVKIENITRMKLLWNSQFCPDAPDEDEDAADVVGDFTDDAGVVVESALNSDCFGDVEAAGSRLTIKLVFVTYIII